MAIVNAAVRDALYFSFCHAKKASVDATEYNNDNNLYKVFAVSKITDDYTIEIPFLVYNYIIQSLNASIFKNVNEIATHIGNLSKRIVSSESNRNLLLQLLNSYTNKSNKIYKFLSKDKKLYIGGSLCIFYDDFTPLFMPTLREYYTIEDNRIVKESNTLVIYTSPCIYNSSDYVERYVAKKLIPHLMSNYHDYISTDNIEIVTTDCNPNFICKVDNNPNVVMSNIMDNRVTKTLLDNMDTITSTICL